jgi:hypothetical protein
MCVYGVQIFCIRRFKSRRLPGPRSWRLWLAVSAEIGWPATDLDGFRLICIVWSKQVRGKAEEKRKVKSEKGNGQRHIHTAYAIPHTVHLTSRANIPLRILVNDDAEDGRSTEQALLDAAFLNLFFSSSVTLPIAN